MPIIKFISNETHYKNVIEKSLTVKQSLWIGTANIKDLYIKTPLQNTMSYLGALSHLISRRVELRLFFAKKPGKNFREDFDRYPLLVRNLETAICPRVHFKIFIFDQREAYIGSAKLTGAGLGMKSPNNRNFEAGVLTDIPEMVQWAIYQFDEVWMGKHCANCGRKKYCEQPISQLL